MRCRPAAVNLDRSAFSPADIALQEGRGERSGKGGMRGPSGCRADDMALLCSHSLVLHPARVPHSSDQTAACLVARRGWLSLPYCTVRSFLPAHCLKHLMMASSTVASWRNLH